MNKFDFINWEITVKSFGYTDKKLKPTDKVIVNCKHCLVEMIIRFSSIRHNHGKDFSPQCHSCGQKKVWDDEEYRKNQITTHVESSKTLWENDDYRRKVQDGVKTAHQTIIGYTEKATEHLQNPEVACKRIANITAKYATDPTYKEKLSVKTKNWHANPKNRQAILEIMRSKEVRDKISKAIKILWKTSYRDRLLQIMQSPERREALSVSSKILWDNEQHRERVRLRLADPTLRAYFRMTTAHWWLNHPEARQACSERSKANWRNPEYRQKMLALYSTKEYKEHQSKVMCDLWSNPEYVTKVMNNSSSKLEDKLSEILTDFNITHTRQFHLGYWPFDFMIAHQPKNILIEVHGEYWHGERFENSRFRDKAKATFVDRYHSDNYELKVIWEKDFLSPEMLDNQIRSWFGTEPTIIDYDFADISITPIVAQETNLFLSKYHYTASGGRNGISIGAKVNGTLIAVAKFCGPTREESATRLKLKQNELMELTRFAIHPNYRKKNLATWFLSRCYSFIPDRIRMLLTFADTTHGHAGTIYKAGGWIYDGLIAPDYFYRDSQGFVIHKRTLWGQAKKMSMNEKEYAEMHGYQKQMGGPKHRFLKPLGPSST